MKNSKNKGITLMATIITIIVLLIFAGVIIEGFINGEGLLMYTEKANTQTTVAEKRELLQSEINNVLIESVTNKKR